MDDKPVNVSLPLSGELLKTLPEEDRRRAAKVLVALGGGLGDIAERLLKWGDGALGWLERRVLEWSAEDRERQLALMESAVTRAGAHGENSPPPNRRIVSEILDSSTVESDDNIRELWTNLLANEIKSGSVHPEFVAILRRMNHEDAIRLLEIAKREGFGKPRLHSSSGMNLRNVSSEIEPTAVLRGIGEAFQALLALPWNEILVAAFSKIGSHENARAKFVDEHLVELRLLKMTENRGIRLTDTGRTFLLAVSDPSLLMEMHDSPEERAPPSVNEAEGE